MSIIITLLVVALVLGGLFWANNTYIAPGFLRVIINIVLILIGIGILLNLTGFVGSTGTFHLGK